MLEAMAIGAVASGVAGLFQGVKDIATAPQEEALRNAQLQQMKDDKAFQQDTLDFQKEQSKFQRAQAILGRSQAQFQRSQAESQRFQSQLAQQQFNINVQAKNRQDQLALEAANLNVEAINKQIGNRQDVLRGEIGAYDKQSRGILGEQRAAMGASGAAIMAGSSGQLVEAEIGAVRATGRERIEQQAAFDVERLQFEQARQQKQADVLDPMQTGKVQDQYQQSTNEIPDITADPVPSLSWLDDDDEETTIRS